MPHRLLQLSIHDRLTVFQKTLIKLIRRKLSDSWCHPVLNIEHEVWNATVKEPLKHTPTIISPIAVFRENSSWELLVVAN